MNYTQVVFPKNVVLELHNTKTTDVFENNANSMLAWYLEMPEQIREGQEKSNLLTKNNLGNAWKSLPITNSTKFLICQPTKNNFENASSLIRA